jgi:hypothetical protein
MPYTLDPEKGQIIGPLGNVVADVHGLHSPRGLRDAESMLRALNHKPERLHRLRRLRAQAEELSESALATEADLRRLAGILAEVVVEAAR